MRIATRLERQVASCFVIFLSLLALSHTKVITETWNVKWQFIAPDGFYRGVIMINDAFPGPTLRSVKGDTLNITVVNHLMDSTLAIHWHGISQHGTPFMDGAAMVTQFPIVPMHSFRYEFVVDEPGTFWYHAHTPMQYLDGLSGALIVEDPTETKSWTREEVIIIQEWYHEPGLTMAAAGWWSDEEKYRHLPAATTLIHGKGRSNCSALYPASPMNWRCSKTEAPLFSLNISPQERVLLRIIGGMSEDPMRFSIDEHDLEVIRFQKHPIQPIYVKSIDFHAGYRYDVVVTGKSGVAPGARMGIHADLMYGPAERCNNSCFSKRGMGWIQYPSVVTSSGQSSYQAFSTQRLTLSAQSFNTLIASQSNLNDKPPASTIQWPIDFIQNVTTNPHKPHEGQIPLFSFNNLLFAVPARPTIMEVYQDHTFSWPRDSLIWTAPLNSVIDVYFRNRDGSDHPIHLHGYNFYILSIGDTTTSVQGIDNFPTLPTLNEQNPARGDTVLVPAHGWAYLRIVANNPGIWTFHCHVDSHNAPNAHHAMIMVFAIGVETLPLMFPLPENFPKIVGDVYQGRNYDQKSSAPLSNADSSSVAAVAIPVLAVLCIILLCIIIFLIIVHYRDRAGANNVSTLENTSGTSYRQFE